jgi:hypothetical protein
VVEGDAGNDRMTLKCEVAEPSANLSEAIVGSIREVTQLRGEVELVAPGSLPNDGKVIEDCGSTASRAGTRLSLPPPEGCPMRHFLPLLLTTLAFAATGQTPPLIEGPVYVATYVELVPAGIGEGSAVLKQYRDAARKDAGNQRMEAAAGSRAPEPLSRCSRSGQTRRRSRRTPRRPAPRSFATSSRR